MKSSPFAPHFSVQVPQQLAPRTANYSLHTPSAPHIHIPAPPDNLVLPAYEGVGGEHLTEDDLKTITQVPYVVTDQSSQWTYDMRRSAQPILPFIYLGPSSAAKDRDLIQREGITMLLAVRDGRSAQAFLLNRDKVANELGIESASVDVTGPQELIAAFPRAIKTINDHLLSVYRRQALTDPNHNDGHITINQGTFKRGKVLVFCESGNERSACVVAAYMMAMYGMDLVNAILMMQLQRFCVALDDPMKHLLQSYQEILQAGRDVGKARRDTHASLQGGEASSPIQAKKADKRHIEETLDEDMDVDMEGQMDKQRFEGRDGFVPFYDGN